MRALLIILSMSISLSAMANCKVYIPVKYFLHDSGYGIGFDFTAILEKKNYEETLIPEEASYQLNLNGTEVTGRFHKALTYMELIGRNGEVIKTEKAVTCFTQYCAISDYSKSFNHTMRQLGKLIPSCR
jgi:hypothetical protein